MHKISQVGIVRNSFKEPSEPDLIREEVSEVVVDEAFAEGLYKIENSKYLDIVFHFHLNNEFELVRPVKSGQVKGVFASRAPMRPNFLGITTVELIAREDNVLFVRGLDALNGSPVYDIKPCDLSIFETKNDEIERERSISNPRRDIVDLIKRDALEELLFEAAKFHGHFCTGLALGVKAAVFAMKEIDGDSNGLEDLLAIIETNNCFSDGIQLVTGCSFGNNGLVFKDIGKIAVTITNRKGYAIRISLKPHAREYLHAQYPDFSEAYENVIAGQERNELEISNFKTTGHEKAMITLQSPFDKLFNISYPKKLVLPDYAPVYKSFICDSCGENVMQTRIIAQSGKKMCLSCSSSSYLQLTGNGIEKF